MFPGYFISNTVDSANIIGDCKNIIQPIIIVIKKPDREAEFRLFNTGFLADFFKLRNTGIIQSAVNKKFIVAAHYRNIEIR